MKSKLFWYEAFAVIILMGIVGRCEMREELPTPALEQGSEIMSRQTAQERENHVDMASRILAEKVEKDWRERR